MPRRWYCESGRVGNRPLFRAPDLRKEARGSLYTYARRCRRKSRRYAALPFGGFDPPPGPRPLCGHCPGLILRLAATRLPGALRLCSMPGRAYGATVTSAASHAFIFHRKWALCAHSVFYIIRSVVFRNHGCTRVSLSAKEPPLRGSAFSGASTLPRGFDRSAAIARG